MSRGGEVEGEGEDEDAVAEAEEQDPGDEQRGGVVKAAVDIGSLSAAAAASESGNRRADEICWPWSRPDSAASSTTLRMTRAGLPYARCSGGTSCEMLAGGSRGSVFRDQAKGLFLFRRANKQARQAGL